jgi:hypothetical protein
MDMRASVRQGRADVTSSRTPVTTLSRPSHRMSILQRTHPAGSLSNQTAQRWLPARTRALAPMIGAAAAWQASEAHEREADRAAAAVMRMPEDRSSSAADRTVARQMDLRDFGGSQPVEDSDEESIGVPAVHRQSAGPSGVPVAPAELASSIDHAGHSGGQPLPADARQFMEGRFGGDFAGVRIHTDRAAGDLAHQLQARAFTTGHRIFFAPGEFQPNHASGRHLLAHELAHVIQQRHGSRGADRAIQFKKTGCQACGPYCGYDTSKDLESYNCSGLSRRTYDYPDLTAAKAALGKATKVDCADPCARVGMVKHWFWEYDSHLEDSKGTKLFTFDPDFHTVSGPTAGDPKPKDSDECYSKDGKRKVYGPGTGPRFKPPARAQATSNDPSETPGTDRSGKPLIKVCSVTAESCYCLPCPPAPARQKTRRRKS